MGGVDNVKPFLIAVVLIVTSLIFLDKQILKKKIPAVLRGVVLIVLTFVATKMIPEQYMIPIVTVLIVGTLGILGGILTFITKDGDEIGELLILNLMAIDMCIIFI